MWVDKTYQGPTAAADPWASFPDAAPTAAAPAAGAPATADPWSAFPDAPAPPADWSAISGTNIGRAAVRGIPVAGSFLDEAASALNATIAPALNAVLPSGSQEFTQPTWQERYDAALAKGRGMDKAFDTANPGTSLASQVVGGTIATLPLAATAAGARLLGLTGDTMLGRIGSGMASGAGIGAASGYGSGEGGVANRLESAGTGSAIGAGFGIAAPVVGAIAGKIVGAGQRAAAGARARISDNEPFRQAAQILGHGGEEPVTVAIAPHIMAAKKLAGALNADAVTPQAAGANPQAMLGELGPNLTEMSGGIVAKRGEGQTLIKQATDARTSGASDRISAALDATLGPNRDVLQTAEDISAAQSARAKPLYDAIRDRPVFLSDNMRFVLGTKAGKAALAHAQSLAEGFGQHIDPSAPTAGGMDFVKQALDDQIGQAVRAGASKKAASLSNLKNTLLRELDHQVPEYAAARQAWAGPAAVKDALEAGQGAFSNDVSPGALRRQLAAMTQSERVAYAIGARSQIAQVMGTARTDAGGAIGVFRKGWNAEKLRMIVGKDNADGLLATIEQERNLKAFDTDVLHNSKTAARLLSNKALEDQTWMRHTLGTARLAFSVNGFKGLRNITAVHMVEGLLGSHDEARNEQVAAIIARGLVKTGPERDALIRALNKGLSRMNDIERRSSGAASLVRALTSAAGAAATPAVTREATQSAP